MDFIKFLFNLYFVELPSFMIIMKHLISFRRAEPSECLLLSIRLKTLFFDLRLLDSLHLVIVESIHMQY